MLNQFSEKKIRGKVIQQKKDCINQFKSEEK